jgi:hypothetical protein
MPTLRSILHQSARAVLACFLLASCLGQSCGTPLTSLPLDDEQVLGFRPGDPNGGDAGATIAPVARALDPLTVDEGQSFDMDARLLFEGGVPEQFTWSQESGPEVNLPAGGPTATLIAPAVDADQTVVLLVTGTNAAGSATARVEALVQNIVQHGAESIEIVASSLDGDAPLTVDFKAAVDGGDLPEGLYNWTFGDGYSSIGGQVSHLFASPGVYTTQLCVSLRNGSKGCSEVVITVSDPSENNGGTGNNGQDNKDDPGVLTAKAGPDLYRADLDGNTVEAVTLDGSASYSPGAPIVSYTWKLNGSTIAVGPVVVVNFSLGTHYVTLIVTTSDGQTAQDTLTVTVSKPASYYVATNGNDNWSGQLPDPNTNGTDGPFKTIQKAVNLAGPGDVIYIRGGEYVLNEDKIHVGAAIAMRRSGAPGFPITVAGTPGETVLLRTLGSKPVFDFTNSYGNDTRGLGWFVFRNLKIIGGKYGWMFYPLRPDTWVEGDPLEDLMVNQLHDIVIEDCEVFGNGVVQSGIYARNCGVRNLTVRRCRFHHCIGTEGNVDIGEWPDNFVAHGYPKSASHDLLFEDCDFYNAVHQQANGIVFQPCVYNVTLRRCRAWNNGKYGLACKGSDNFVVDRCAAWGNDSTQMYCRGFGGDSGAERDAFASNFTITNSIFIAPADQRGGSAVNWRENTNLNLYNCTIIGLRDGSLGEAGGYSFLCSNAHAIPCTLKMKNTIVAGYTNSNSMRMMDSDPTTYLLNTRYEGDRNVFFGTFRYMSWSWSTLDKWQTFWATGAPNGDDGMNGPTATFSDTNSRMGDPQFARFAASTAPRRKQWSDNLWDDVDLHVTAASPAVAQGENLTYMNMPDLMVDYNGNPRPTNGPWTIGALQIVAP